jgi:hypothetical protein
MRVATRKQRARLSKVHLRRQPISVRMKLHMYWKPMDVEHAVNQSRS